MRLLIRIIGSAFIGALVVRLILKRTGGPEGVAKLMMEVMPKVMDGAFSKLAPAKRQEMLAQCHAGLAQCHAVLARLEEKYGTGTEHARSL